MRIVIDTAAISHACKRMPAFVWAVAISAAILSPMVWNAKATQHPVKDQARHTPELSPAAVLFTRDDPWVVKEVATISYRGDHYAVKPTQEADRSERKRLEQLKKKLKRSNVDDVIRRASREALLANAKAAIGKRGPQLGLPGSLWCADAINYWLRKVGLPTTGSRMARSFVAHPKFEKIKAPQPGDIVVIARGRGTTYGHVALYNGSCGKGGIKLLGGNQGGGRVTNQCISGARVVGYVRPKTIPETVIARLLT